MEHRDGTHSVKTAKVHKSIYSLPILLNLMASSNERYLAFISALDDPTDGDRRLPDLAAPVKQKGRSWRGFNLCSTPDHQILLAIAPGESSFQGLNNKHLRARLGMTSRQVPTIIRRLRFHSILRKAPRAYRYYLTRLGQCVIAVALRIRHEVLVPALAGGHP